MAQLLDLATFGILEIADADLYIQEAMFRYPKSLLFPWIAASMIPEKVDLGFQC
jgi:hypothetical protein